MGLAREAEIAGVEYDRDLAEFLTSVPLSVNRYPCARRSCLSEGGLIVGVGAA